MTGNRVLEKKLEKQIKSLSIEKNQIRTNEKEEKI